MGVMDGNATDGVRQDNIQAQLTRTNVEVIYIYRCERPTKWTSEDMEAPHYSDNEVSGRFGGDAQIAQHCEQRVFSQTLVDEGILAGHA